MYINLPRNEDIVNMSARIPISLKENIVRISKDRNISFSDIMELSLDAVVSSDEIDEMLSISRIIFDYQKQTHDNFDYYKIETILKKYKYWDISDAYCTHGMTPPIVAAVETDNLKVFEYLLNNIGSQVMSKCRTFTTVAVTNVHYAFRLLEYKFDINSVNHNGNNILHLLINRHFLSTHNHTSDPHHPDCRKDFLHILPKLLKSGINVNKQNHDGNTPLHLLLLKFSAYNESAGKLKGKCRERVIEIVNFIIDAGVDIKIKNHNQASIESLFLT